MAKTSGRGQSAYAVRLGVNNDALAALERNQQRLAQDQAYQAKLKQEQLAKQQKEFLNPEFDTDGLSYGGTEAVLKQAKQFNQETQNFFKQNPDNLLSAENQEYLRNREREISGNIQRTKAYTSDLESLHKSILKNEELYNLDNVVEQFNEVKNNMFNEDGSFNTEVPSIKTVAEKINSASNLNESQVAKRFADTIEETLLSDVQGNVDIEYKSKFAEYNPDTKLPQPDDNGDIMVKVTPETVAMAKKDSYMKKIMDARVAEAKANGQENYTYKDALQVILKGQQVSELKQTNKSSGSAGNTKDYSDVQLVEAPTVQYNPDFDANGGILGYRSQEALLNSMKIDNVNITSDDGSNKETLYGDVQRMYTDNEGNPMLEIITTQTGGRREPRPIPLNESTFKQLRGFADKEGKKVLDQLYNKIKDGGTKLYPSPKKIAEVSTSLAKILEKSTERSWNGGDVRSSDELQNQILELLKQQGLSIDESKLSADVSGIIGSNNEIKYKQKTYFTGNLQGFVDDILKENAKKFAVEQDVYDRQYNEVSMKPEPTTTQTSEVKTGDINDLPDIK